MNLFGRDVEVTRFRLVMAALAVLLAALLVFALLDLWRLGNSDTGSGREGVAGARGASDPSATPLPSPTASLYLDGFGKPIESTLDGATAEWGADKVYDVVVTFSANGLFRSGYSDKEGNKSASDWGTSTVTVRHTLNGPGPLVISAAQAGPQTTKLTCTITVDGKQYASRTASKPFHVTVCMV